MAPNDVLEFTRLLQEWRSGDELALNQLLPAIHDELVRMARRSLRSRSGDETLVPAGLVNEVYLRLCGTIAVDWKGRGHFYAVAAQMMRRILIDRARARTAEKRGGGLAVTLADDMGFAQPPQPDVLDLDDALTELEKLDQRQAQIIEMRFFTGLSLDETAAALDISVPTVKRDWTVAKAWMRRRLHGSTAQQA